MNVNIAPVKKFSVIGLFATLGCMIVLAISLIAVIVFRQPGNFPGFPISGMLLAGGVGSIFGWLYFATGRLSHGWVLATSLAFSTIEVATLTLLESRAAGSISLSNDAGAFATMAAIDALLTVALIASLLRAPTPVPHEGANS